MRICQLLPSNSSGGLAKHFIELSNELSKEYDVTTICPKKFKYEFTEKVNFIEFESKSSHRTPFNIYRLYRALKQARPDILHAHGNLAANYASMAKYWVRVATLGTIHWKLKRKKNSRGYEKLDGVIGVSSGVLAGIKNPNQQVIHLGVTPVNNLLPSFRSQIISDYNLSPDESICLAIGRLVKGKGFDLLIRSWQGVNANLLIVGEGPLYKELNALVKELDLSNVRLCGPINNVAKLIPSIDLVTISSYSEGFGYVLAEALINKKPVISTEVFASVDILPKCALAPIGDEDKLREIITSAVSDLEEYNRKLKPAYLWAENNLPMELFIEKTVKFYEKLISEVG